MDPKEIARVMRYLTTATEVQGRIIVEILKVTDGKLPDETSRAIHKHLRPLEDAALAVPQEISAIRVLDLLFELFPPPDLEADGPDRPSPQ